MKGIMQLNLDYFNCETKDIPVETWGGAFCRILKLFKDTHKNDSIYVNPTLTDNEYMVLSRKTSRDESFYINLPQHLKDYLNRNTDNDFIFSDSFKTFLRKTGGRHFNHIERQS